MSKDEGWIAECNDYELLDIDDSICLRNRHGEDKVIIPRDTFLLLMLSWITETPDGKAVALKASEK